MTPNGMFLPFLYPCLYTSRSNAPRVLRTSLQLGRPKRKLQCLAKRHIATVSSTQEGHEDESFDETPESELDRLDPPPDSYSITPFTDRCSIVLNAGAGGHGCISFLREKYIENGPPNGGDGGTGGNIYIQAVQGETSLHKLARRGILKAGRGKNGQGKGQGGTRGEDILITVPVGTIVREVWRHDPIAEEELADKRAKAMGADANWDNEQPGVVDNTRKWRRDKWLLFPGAMPQSFTSADFPPLPRPRRSQIAMAQPPAPIRLDLDAPMEAPQLLAAGAMGGLGNPHFVTKSITRPKYGTKGDEGMKVEIQLELKLLADVGLVGLPNAGKSTLLRAITNSRARIGNWAFTTLQPNIGTVVLDNHKGRPLVALSDRRKGPPRTNFTIADIPGLIEDAHLDRGLGLGFLRHIERAGILAFVIDLSAGDAITALKGLWKEVGQYELLRDQEVNAESERRIEEEKELVRYSPLVKPQAANIFEDGETVLFNPDGSRILPELKLPPISSKPWLVIATKADLPETRENFKALQEYLKKVGEGEEIHPSGKKNAWRKKLHAIPISAIKAQGVERITPIVVDLLEN
ncbi:GTP-binding protein Obg/CgtA [Aureobasidium pullulans]|uniref:GTP-binding protein Obg/CgtA n=1 Tax=Aureobasidium pullulans TaxID=5580 RepID=A0A4S9XYQ4_AURPU|nr:GTP-binding protein Obg/CgtA [Aureobasidium pullulans]